MANDKELKIVFAPGCFDTFEGTQEELDELIKEITDTFTNSSAEELIAQSREVDFDTLMENDPEFAKMLLAQFAAADANSIADRVNECKNAKADAIRNAVYNTKRTLH